MKWSFASVGLIMLGLFGIVIIMLFNDITVTNEQDYYTLKYATEASMLESVDVAYYRLTGEIKINQEKFVENFTRRFTETSTFGQGNYGIVFYQINETPPKVSLRIYDKTSGYNIYTYTSDVATTQADIVNELSAIIEGIEKDEEIDGYKIDNPNGDEIAGIEPVSKDKCDAKVVVGKNNITGEDVYKCNYGEGEEAYLDISGSVIKEENINFNILPPQDNSKICVEGTIKFAGRVENHPDQYLFSCRNYNGDTIYRDAEGNLVSKDDVSNYKPPAP